MLFIFLSNAGAIDTVAWRALRVSFAWQNRSRAHPGCIGITSSAVGWDLNGLIHGGDGGCGLSHNHHHNHHSHQTNLVFHLHMISISISLSQALYL